MDFVFMTESLDGGAVTYRSNRHFDILNENIVFPLQSARPPRITATSLKPAAPPTARASCSSTTLAR